MLLSGQRTKLCSACNMHWPQSTQQSPLRSNVALAKVQGWSGITLKVYMAAWRGSAADDTSFQYLLSACDHLQYLEPDSVITIISALLLYVNAVCRQSALDCNTDTTLYD